MLLGGRASDRCLGPEGAALVNGISVLIKESPQNSPALPPSEDTVGSLQPRRGPSFDHAGTWISDFQPLEL